MNTLVASYNQEWLCYPDRFLIGRYVRNWSGLPDHGVLADHRHSAVCSLPAREVLLMIQTLVIASPSPVSPK